jgi:(p)ppGpp synthase/HD superfamily hydrolase
MNRVEQAIILAIEAHSGQKDKQGKYYFWHVISVSQMGKTEDEQIIGALHDVLEDCTPYWKNRAENFCDGYIQLTALRLLSRINKDGTKKDPEDYYEDIKNNPLALAVKANDIAHNTSPERLDPLPEYDKQYLIRKYRKAKEALGLL